MSRVSGYRADIDGLRALAVLAVIIFHLDSTWLPGGFIGVDVFFVISGFLITGIINRQVEAGSFSFAEFYRRRILRILPAATLVIATTLIVGHFIMLPDDLTRLAYSAIASQLWVGNIYFTYYLDTGYFADAAILQPLLHLWSLGVEEQFYLFWPAILLLGLTWLKPRIFWAVASVGMIASFALGQALLPDNASFAYYMLPPRAGQLLAGGLAAVIVTHWLPKSILIATVMSLLGFALVAWSLYSLNGGVSYPGINAIAPTLAAVLFLIAGGHQKNLVSVIFRLPVIRYVGLISFSLYLWHWPVISFYWYLFGAPGLTAKALLFSLTLILSIASYHFVENPVRRLKIGPMSAFLRAALAPGALVLAMSVGLWATSGFGFYTLSAGYVTDLQQAMADGGPASRAPYVCQRPLINQKDLEKPECEINGDKPKVLLWGDSNASHHVGAMMHAAKEFGFSFRNIAHSSCPPLMQGAEKFVQDRVVENCKQSTALVANSLAEYDVIILVASWDIYLRNEELKIYLGNTIDEIKSLGKEVFVFGVIPRLSSFDRKCNLKKMKFNLLDCDASNFYNRSRTETANIALEKIATDHNAIFVSFADAICKDGSCPTQINDTDLYYDAGHWSVAGSLLVGKTLAEAGKLPPELSVISNLVK